MVTLLLGCKPEVGSDRWCNLMDETPKDEWSTNNVKEYARNCVLRKKQ